MDMLRFLFSGRRLIFTLVVIVGFGMLCRLGLWQWDRHLQRSALNAQIEAGLTQPPLDLTTFAGDPAQLDYRRVTISGQYDAAGEILLRNRSYDGTTGYHLVAPLRLADGRAALIDRGWIPYADGGRTRRAAFAPPQGTVTVVGVARRSQTSGGPPEQVVALGERRDAWFRLDTAEIGRQLGYDLLPVFVEVQPSDDARVLPQPVKTEDLGLGSHLGYTLQWFSFAIILVGGYLAVSYRQLRQRGRETGAKR